MGSNASKPERKIVLLGKTGDGKSSAGNTVLRKKVFSPKASPKAVKLKSVRRDRMVDGRKITAIDTPGFFDTDRDDEEMKSEIVNSLIECAPVDAFVIVLKVGRYTRHENEVVQKLLDTFNEEHILKHTVILFTFGEQLEGQSIEEFVKTNSQLQELVDKCGGRCHVIDNKYWNKRLWGNKRNRVQVKHFLKTIDKMVKENGCFTSELHQIVEKNMTEDNLSLQEVENNMTEDNLSLQEVENNMTEDNLSPEEKREKAKEIVHEECVKRLAGVATGTLTGAVLGIGVAVTSVAMLLPRENATGVFIGIPLLAGAVRGGVIGYNAAKEADSVDGAMKRAAEVTYAEALHVKKKVQEFPLVTLNPVWYKI